MFNKALCIANETSVLVAVPHPMASTATNQPQKSKKIRQYVALHSKLAYLCKKYHQI